MRCERALSYLESVSVGFRQQEHQQIERLELLFLSGQLCSDTNTITTINYNTDHTHFILTVKLCSLTGKKKFTVIHC